MAFWYLATLIAGLASRSFNGWPDDSALFRGAMSASDIARLTKQIVDTCSGLSAGASVASSASAAPLGKAIP